MRHKKAGVSLVVAIIIAILLVGIVSFISSKSIFASLSGIFEPLKKLMGAETTKTEAPTGSDACLIKRYYWQPNNARFGDEVNIVIEASGKCDGKDVKVLVYDDLRGVASKPSEEYGPPPKFKGSVIQAKWYVQNRRTPATLFKGYYFTVEFGNFKGTSDDLTIIQ